MAVMVLDYVINFFFAVDIVVNFRCTYLDEMNDEVWDPHAIARRYMKGSFFIDILASIPFDVLINAFSLSASRSTLRVISLVKLIRLLRLRRIITYLRTNKDFKLSLQFFLILFSALLFAHLITCAWHALIMLREQWTPLNNETVGVDFYLEMSAWKRYLTCFYYSMLGKDGFDIVPSTAAEMAFAAASASVGGVITAVILGFVTVILDNLDKQNAEFIDKLESMQEVMIELNVSDTIRSHVNAYMQHTYRSRDTQNHLRNILESLPSSIRFKVIQSLVSSTVKTHPLFKKKDRALLMLQTHIQVENFIPEQEIFQLGSEADKFFLICSGEVLVNTRATPEIPSVARVLQRGMAFGEVGLIHKCRRTATVTTKNFSTLGYIDRVVFEDMMEEEPGLRGELIRVILSYQDGWRHFVVKSLMHLPYLRGCESSDLQDLSFQATEVQYTPSQLIIARGEMMPYVLLVASGVVRGWACTRYGDTCILKLQHGDIAGVYSVLDKSPIPLALTCSTTALVIKISMESIHRDCHLELAHRSKPVAKALAQIRSSFDTLFEKTGDYQLRRLANMYALHSSQLSVKERVMGRFQMLMLRVISQTYRRRAQKALGMFEVVQLYREKMKEKYCILREMQRQEQVRFSELQVLLLKATSNVKHLEDRVEACEELLIAKRKNTKCYRQSHDLSVNPYH